MENTRVCPSLYDCRGTYCCLTLKDVTGLPCSLPPEPGIQMSGVREQGRWAWSNGQCQPFRYLGVAGNANNFRSHRACQLACAGDDSLAEDIRCSAPNRIHNSAQGCSQAGGCPDGYFCLFVSRQRGQRCCGRPGPSPRIPQTISCTNGGEVMWSEGTARVCDVEKSNAECESGVCAFSNAFPSVSVCCRPKEQPAERGGACPGGVEAMREYSNLKLCNRETAGSPSEECTIGPFLY